MAELSTRPLVSAVMALQNGARFLDDSIGSILSQDYEPIELIVIESASSDGSFERARELAPRAGISSYPATEPGPARNLGLERASGELIAFCDADDVWVPGRITAMVDALRSSPEAGLVFGQLETFQCPQLSGDERARLWSFLATRTGYGDLDGFARRRPTETAVVVLEPR